MRRLGQHLHAVVRPRTASSIDLLGGRVEPTDRDADPPEGRASSDDGVTSLPSRDCEFPVNQSQVDSGAQPKRKSISASAFVCQFLVKLLVERHRRKLMVPEISAMLPLFEDMRVEIKAQSRTCEEFEDFERLVCASTMPWIIVLSCLPCDCWQWIVNPHRV